MNSLDEANFLNQCKERLHSFISQFGFGLAAIHRRPRGIVVEFVADGRTLFVVCEEESILILDLIIHADNGVWRVSLNQALWFSGVKSMVKGGSCVAQLDAFIDEAPAKLKPLLSGKLSALDPAYCFFASQTDYDDYVASQTGN